MKRLRVAVLGAGSWGINHARIIAAERGCELAMMVDPDPAAAERAREHTSAPIVADSEVAFADSTVDAVVIATPASTHPGLASSALRAGKHVLVEKPLALNLADARAVADVAHASGRVAMVGHLMVYHPAIVRSRELLRSGTLGRLHYLHATRANIGHHRPDESALWTFGPHDVSILDFLLESIPVSVTARGQCVYAASVEDVVFVTLRYRTGVMAHIHLSRLHPRKERRLAIVCEQKMLEFDDVSSEKLRIHDRGHDRPPMSTQFADYLTIRDGDVHIPVVAMEEPLRLEIRHFLRCIERSAAPTTDLSSAIRVTAVLEAAQRSLTSDGAPMPVCI